MTATADPQTVVLRFHRRASLYVRERTWHHSQQVDGLEEGAVRLTLRVGLSPELVSWVLGFGPDVRVESPPELVERIRRLHREAAEEA
jgi:predicted DNA-binding transcriptional regulator YafY